MTNPEDKVVSMTLELNDGERDALLILLHMPRSDDCGLTDKERTLLDGVMRRLHEANQ